MVVGLRIKTGDGKVDVPTHFLTAFLTYQLLHHIRSVENVLGFRELCRARILFKVAKFRSGDYLGRILT